MRTHINNQPKNLSSSKDIALIGFAICFSLIGGTGYLFDQTWMLIFAGLGLGLLFLIHPFWGLLLFTVLLPLESSFLGLSGGAVTVTRYLGIFISVVWLFKIMMNRQKIDLPPILISTACLVAWGAASVLWAISKSVTLSRLMTAAQLVLLLVLVINFIKNEKMLKMLLAALVFGCLIAMLMGLLGIGVAEYGELLTLDDQGAKEYGSYVGIVFLVSSLFFFYQKGTWRWLGLLGVLLAMITLIRVNQRGVLLAIGIAWAGIAVISRQKFRTIALIILILVMFNFSIDYLYNSGVIDDYLLERLTVQNVLETGGTGRAQIWSVGWRMFLNNPLSGVGWGNYPTAYPRYVYSSSGQGSDFVISNLAPKNAHSDVIGLAGELGIPGLILFLVMLSRIAITDLNYFIGLKKEEPKLSELIIFSLFIYIFANGLTSILLYRKVYWLILGLAIVFPTLPNFNKPETSERSQNIIDNKYASQKHLT